jgi:hypothetical protein
MALRYMALQSIVRSGLAVALLLAGASTAAAQLCPGVTDPCVITDSVKIDSGTVLDIGARGLVIAASKTITVQGAGVFTINAGSVTFEDSAKIVANGANGFGGIIVVVSQGPFQMATGSLIDVSSANGGSIDVTANTGDIVLGGKILGTATTRGGIGGDVAFTTLDGNVQVAGLGINVTGGDVYGDGGYVYIDAAGDALVAADIQNKGSDGGDLDLYTDGDATVASGVTVNLNGLDIDFGDGGDPSIDAGGNLTFAGDLSTNGAGGIDGGGDGGYTDFSALGDLVVSGTIVATGPSDGSGGDVDLDGATVEVTGSMDLTGPAQGDGGDLFVISSVNALIDAPVDVRAGTGSGTNSFGGSIEVISDEGVVIGPSAVLQTTGEFQAGTIDVFGCSVTIHDGALLESLGPVPYPGGTNTVQASGVATIGGVAQATVENRVEYREFMPVVAPQAGTSPAWNVVQNAALPCCVGCPTTTTTSTTTSTSSTSSSTTSTSSTSSTTTSIPGATTSTSTSSTSSTSSSSSSITVTSTSTSTTTTSATSTSTTTSITSTTATSTSSTTSSTALVSTTTTSSTVTTSSSTSTTATTLATTTTEVTSTTSTTMDLGCAAFVGFDAAACELDVLDANVAARSDDDLGGTRPARGLRKRVTQSVTFLQRASVETNLKKTLRFVKRSHKKLDSFEKKIVRFTSKEKIDLSLADELMTQADDAKTQLEAIEVGLSQQ